MKKISACIFDLDGVIVDTAKYHFKAWRRLANELGFDFTEKENEKLKGVGRIDSLKLILKWGGVKMDEASMQTLAAKKNEWYVEDVGKMTSDEIMIGVVDFLDELQAKKIKIGLGSASKNAVPILTQLEIKHYFEVIMDGTNVTKGKPDPEVFLKGAERLKIDPSNCIVFEDASKGVDAALKGGMYAVGVGKEADLGHAHHVIPDFKDLKFDALESILSTKEGIKQ